jgi:uncharacterized protein (DUF342 family)
MPEPAAAPGAGQIRRALFEDRSEERILRAWVSSDGTACGLECQVLSAGWSAASAGTLEALLHRHRVVQGVDRSVLERIAQAARERRTIGSLVVARGTTPEPGRDGALEFIIRPSNESARYRSREQDGRVDYRETNLIENVLAEEPVAIEIPPKPGRDGQDVFGRTLAAPEGEPARFELGAGVRFDPESRQVIALQDGRVIWEDGSVSVSRSFHVRGSVDYSVGNIAFVGDVVVDGDVLDGFNVRTGGRLVIGGNVGACRLDSDGDLEIKGGVFGKGRALLRAKGGLSARFLNDCRAECAGEMKVEREAVGSTLLSNGRLLIVEGRLVGGTTSALCGLEVAVLGSPLGVPTAVSAGTDYSLARRQVEIEDRIREVDASVEKISGFLGPLLGDRRRMSRLIARRREDLRRLVNALRGLRTERAELAGRMEELAEAAQRDAVRQINVRREMHPGVLIELGSVRSRTKNLNRGPITVIEDRGRGSLRTREFRELPGAGSDRRPAAAGRRN